MSNTILNTTDVVIVTNKSGVDLSYGDVVIPASSADKAVTTTTNTAYIGMVGVVIDPGGIANDGRGAVSFKGYVPRINLTGAAARLDDLIPSATPKSAVSSPGASNSMGIALTASATPEAYLYGPFQSTTGEYSVIGGRLTLTTALPVTTSDVTSAATLYYTPYLHGNIGLYYSSAWSVYNSNEISVSLASATSGKNYDVFAYYTGAAVAIETLVWTDDTNRATGLTRQNGIFVKNGEATRRYLGTIRASGAGVCEDSATKRFVWNYYNRVPRPLNKLEATNSWSVSSSSWASANGSTANRVEIVNGVSESTLSLTVSIPEAYSASVIGAQVGIGVDSTTVNSADLFGGAASSSYNSIYSILNSVPSLGYHYFQWLQRVDSGTATFYATDVGSTRKAGMTGTWQS